MYTIRKAAAVMLAVLLTACAQAQTLPHTDASNKLDASQSARDGLLGVPQFDLKTNPGCRSDLKHPLKNVTGSTASDFTQWAAQDLDGSAVTQDLLSGSQLNLVLVWSTYCGTAVRDLAAMQEILDSYSRAQVDVIGILASAQNEDGSFSEEDVAIARQMQQAAGADFPQLLPSDDLVSIRLSQTAAVPESFILDREGNLVSEIEIGARSVEEWKALIEKSLQAAGTKEGTP